MNIHDITKQIRAFADELDATKVSEQPAPFALPTPPPGMQWHRTGWKAEMLPPSTRPMVLGESYKPGDECFIDKTKEWIAQSEGAHGTVQSHHTFVRTTRPLFFQHAGHEWTWHRAGDPMPCEKGKKVYALFHDEEIRGAHTAEVLGWGTDPEFKIIGWRYADADSPPWIKQKLGPSDVPPGSVVKAKARTDFWYLVTEWSSAELILANGWVITYEALQRNFLINRPHHRDSSGNPTLWEPCHK